MKNKLNFIPLFLILIIIQACGGASEESADLSKLLDQKTKLKEELALVQGKIKALEAESKVIVSPLVNISTVEQKEYQHKIIVQGNVETDEDVLLNAEMGGLIKRVHVKEGQFVSVGQVLVSLDAAIISSNMQELETQLQYANYMLNKQEELKKRGVGSEFDYKTAKNQVDALNSKIKSLSTQRGKSSIKAPFSGVIDKIFARNGQIAGPQSPLMRLVNNREVNITADISEKHLENVQVGTEVQIRFPNFHDTIIRLNISRVGNYIDPTNRTFRVMATLKNNKIFLPNMLAELEITDIVAPEAIVVPSKSILKSQQNEDYIFIAQKTKNKHYKAEKVAVELVSRYNGSAHINVMGQNIKPGSFVIVEGAKGINDQDIVRTK